jgi:Protein of Unknown function (DUF2784)
MGYRVLVTVILAVHFGYLAYAVFGEFLAWRWPRAIWPHLVAGAWGLAVVGIPLECPLTSAESWARERAGEPALTRGFIDRFIEGVLYPERFALAMQIAAGVTIVISWVGAYALWRRRRGSARGGRESTAMADTGSNSEVSAQPTATV